MESSTVTRVKGAEHKIFAHEHHRWLPRVDPIMVETHDRFRPGAERAAIAASFEELPRSGENVIFRRRSS